MMSPVQKEFLYRKGRRKYLFCADSTGAECLYNLVHQAMEDQSPFDLLVIEHESDSFLDLWFRQQKMGTYLYLSGSWHFVHRLKNLALEAGLSEYEMQIKILGELRKKLICCGCHGVNDVDDELHISCIHCGLELEASNHYSRRLEAYLGYSSIK